MFRWGGGSVGHPFSIYSVPTSIEIGFIRAYVNAYLRIM